MTSAAGKTQRTIRSSQCQPASPAFPAPAANSQRRMRLQARMLAWALALCPAEISFQWVMSSGLSDSFSSSSLSSKSGSDTTYFSADQLPRSCRRHRSLQKGKSALVAESESFLQIGHRRCMKSNTTPRRAGLLLWKCESASRPEESSGPRGGGAPPDAKGFRPRGRSNRRRRSW